MVRETRVHRFDDLDRAAGAEVEADLTAMLVYGGQAVELDLTAGHDKELAALLAPYLAAGQPVEQPPEARFAGKMSREYAAELRAWADARGMSYKTPGGGTYYGIELRRGFAAWKAAGGGAP